MLKEVSVNLGNFLLSLSDAVDLASPAIASHQLRTAYVAWQMGRAAGLSKERIDKLFMAALLHDIGALAPEDKIRLHHFEERNLETHAARGAWLFELTPLLSPASQIVRFHHKPWKRWEAPIDAPDVLESQVLVLADLVERLIERNQYVLHQVDRIVAKIHSFSGMEIHPDVVDVFNGIAKREDFWLDLTSPRLYSLLLHLGPFRRVEIDLDDISSAALLFRSLIDFRSSFTATHSTGVAESAAILAQAFGLTDNEVSLMRLAGNFHDLGKLAVPNSILNKPGSLTREEFAVMKQHTYFTYTVLNTIGGLDQITEWAAFHHERLDGSGYPFHISADVINTGARIMTVADIFTALAEDRPYRKGMDRKEISTILKNQADRGYVDHKIVNLLLENYDEILPKVHEQQTVTRRYYEKARSIFDKK